MTRRILLVLLAAGLTLTLAAAPARAVVHAGDVAPDFSKVDLNGTNRTLFGERGKVVVMFLLGYD